VIQFRGEGSRKPDALARTPLANLPQLVDSLENGCIVTFEPARVRVRLLPIGTHGGVGVVLLRVLALLAAEGWVGEDRLERLRRLVEERTVAGAFGQRVAVPEVRLVNAVQHQLRPPPAQARHEGGRESLFVDRGLRRPAQASPRGHEAAHRCGCAIESRGCFAQREAESPEGRQSQGQEGRSPRNEDRRTGESRPRSPSQSRRH
jgi:hypothetical protein